MNITKGIVPRAQKVVIYGSEGIGKTTLASQFPDPLFIDTEGGTTHLDVARIDRPCSWKELLSVVREVSRSKDICKTLVIDTADWAEQLAVTHVCSKEDKEGIEGFGYGKGYVYLAEEFSNLLTALDSVINSGIHVVITAHAMMRKFEQPEEMGAYDRWEMKLTKKVAPLLKEWCDTLLFCNYKTFVVHQEDGKEKAQGGKRVMYATHHPCWDAKNRHGLPDEMPLDYGSIAHLFAGAPQKNTALDNLRALIGTSGISEADFRKVVADKGHYPEDTPIDDYPENFINGWCIKHFDKILNIIKEG